MDASQLRIEFDKQIKDADAKITAAESNLRQLQDYKTKLIGGMETLDLLGGATVTPETPEEQQPPTDK